MIRLLLATGLAVAALLMLPTAGRAADGAEIASFADAIAISWLPHQNSAGTFIDPLLGRGSAYGTVMIGYALLRAGVRRGDQKLIEAGIRAFDSRIKTTSPIRSYFNMLPFAKGYTFARAELADNPLWQRSRAGWERYLRSFSRGPSENLAGPCIASATCFHNHEAVQTAAEVALLTTGLVSKDPRSPLRRPRQLERRLLHEVNVAVPRFVGRAGSVSGLRSFRRIGLLSDTGSWSLAYHGLSTAMYGVSLQALPASKTRRGRAALRRAARASLGLMAPDGDVTWLGRRQQEAFALASEISVGMTAARVLQISEGERQSLRTMARIGFARLATRHPITNIGLSNTPRPLVDAPADFARGIQTDPINFNGLTVLLLNLAADRAGTYTTSTMPMSNDGHMIVPDQSGFASIRHGNTWYALRRLEPRSDPRYDFGLLSLKTLRVDGWHDLIEARPVTGRGGSSEARATVGPVIVRDGRRYRPAGRRIRPRPGGVATIFTDFHNPGRKSFALPITYRPSGDGLDVGISPPRSSDRVEFSSFHPSPELQVFADGVSDDEARITVSGLTAVVRRSGFVSCCEPDLTAVTLQAAPNPSRRVTYRIAPIAVPSSTLGVP